MSPNGLRFEDFLLDPANRRLERAGVPVELNARYLDALALLVRERGRLVSKARFLEEVWAGVPVTDDALTQCIRTLRRQLGDTASSPRFIETVPKHGYRFVAAVEPVGESTGGPSALAPTDEAWRDAFFLGAAGTAGAGLAGLLGGLFYGFAASSPSPEAGMGAVSVLLVLTCLTILVALLGGAGVSFAIAAAGLMRGRPWMSMILGGAVGGILVGALVKLLGLDAFTLLFGRAPGEITGAPEGALLGAGVGLGAWLASGVASLRRAVLAGGLAGGAAGLVIILLGGRLMGGSLDSLARAFPDSRLRLDSIGALFGEAGFGPLSQMVTGALEGALFGACVVGAMTLVRRGDRPMQKGRARGPASSV